MIFKKPTTDHPAPFSPPEDDPAATLERDIAELAYAPPKSRLPLPSYVEPNPEAGEIAVQAAQSVVQEFERTAREIEAMGEELIRAARRGAEFITEIQALVSEVNTTAAKYREHGKRAFEEIERQAIMTQDVRRICNELRSKLGG